MFSLRKLIFVMVISWGLVASPRNSLIVRTDTQWQKNWPCHKVGAVDLAAAASNCDPSTNIGEKYAHRDSADIFEEVIFAQAGAKQIKKNRCMSQKLRLLTTNDKPYEVWLQKAMLPAYLAWKKARMMLRYCDASHALNNIGAAASAGVGYFAEEKPEVIPEKKYSPKHHPKDESKAQIFADELAKMSPEKALDNVCKNQYLQILAAIALFENLVPIISNKEAFKILDKNMGQIVDEKGKPITEAQIMAMDMTKASGVKLSDAGVWSIADGGIKAEMNKLFLGIIKERREATIDIIYGEKDDSKGAHLKQEVKKLLGIKSEKTPDIDLAKANRHMSENIKQYIFDEGTVGEVLIENELMPTTAGLDDFLNMKEWFKKQQQAGVLDASMGSLCMMANFAPNLEGELVEMAVYAIPIGGPSLFNAARRLRNLEKSGPMITRLIGGKKGIPLGLETVTKPGFKTAVGDYERVPVKNADGSISFENQWVKNTENWSAENKIKAGLKEAGTVGLMSLLSATVGQTPKFIGHFCSNKYMMSRKSADQGKLQAGRFETPEKPDFEHQGDMIAGFNYMRNTLPLDKYKAQTPSCDKDENFLMGDTPEMGCLQFLALNVVPLQISFPYIGWHLFEGYYWDH